jgi:hypothetical protein
MGLPSGRRELLTEEFVKIFQKAQDYNYERTCDPCKKDDFEEAHEQAKKQHTQDSTPC